MGAPGERTLNLYRARGCTSLLEGDADFAAQFARGDYFILDGQVKVQVERLDENLFALRDLATMVEEYVSELVDSWVVHREGLRVQEDEPGRDATHRRKPVESAWAGVANHDRLFGISQQLPRATSGL